MEKFVACAVRKSAARGGNSGIIHEHQHRYSGESRNPERKPDPKNPLFTQPNTVLSPHAAGPTWESWPKRWGNSYENVQRVACVEKPLWVVPELR